MKRFYWLDKLVKKEDFILGAEVGLKEGKTSGYLLENNPELTMYCIDLWGKAIDNEFDTYSNWNMKSVRAQCLSTLSKFGSRAIVFEEDSVKASNRILDGYLDFVFIDANHTEEGVTRDIDAWMPKIRDGGILSGHDTHFPSVLKVVKEKIPNFQDAPDHVWWIRIEGGKPC